MDKPISPINQVSSDRTERPGDAARLLFDKVREQIELTRKLVARVPRDQLEWRPVPDSFRNCDLLGHLLETLSGFCAALFAVYPHELSDFARLRDLPVNHCCSIEEATRRLREYQEFIAEGFALLTTADLTRRVPTLFTPDGEAVLTILLGNLEHLINHKHQLFIYLKLLGIPVSSRDLYRFRDPHEPTS